jgi:hypothetical protein
VWPNKTSPSDHFPPTESTNLCFLPAEFPDKPTYLIHSGQKLMQVGGA